MESVSSNSPPPSPAFAPPLPPRLSRALHERLLLLHRSTPTFHVLGATANVYAVTLAPTPSCSCPDPTIPCKHILFVLLRVLRLPLSHPALRRRSLLQSPTSPAALAGARARRRFRHLFLASAGDLAAARGPCPVCLEQMGEEEGTVTCSTCGNALHERCWARWKRSRGRKSATCVMCRARWREKREMVRGEQYVNLAGYVGREEDEDDDRRSCNSTAAPG